MGKKRFKEGKFIPKHPEKYRGDVNNIRYKSSWEEYMFKTFLDSNPNVLEWAYEPIAIPYLKPDPSSKRGFREALYLPDFIVVFKDRTGKIVKEMIEVKPKKQTNISKARKEKTRMMENYVYMVNMAKWEAAKHWCQQHGLTFRLLTEDGLFR